MSTRMSTCTSARRSGTCIRPDWSIWGRIPASTPSTSCSRRSSRFATAAPSCQIGQGSGSTSTGAPSRGTRVSDSWRGAPPPDRRLDDAASAAGPFTFPWDAPLFGPFPMQFRDASILTVCWRTDPAAIERLLPPPLERVGDVVVAHIYRMPDVDFAGSVHECNVMVGARLEAGGESVTGGYSVGLYLDSDAGVAHGREVHGQPKKLASLALETRGDLIVGEVERNGITILT